MSASPASFAQLMFTKSHFCGTQPTQPCPGGGPDLGVPDRNRTQGRGLCEMCLGIQWILRVHWNCGRSQEGLWEAVTSEQQSSDGSPVERERECM
jgi:hypothetical protein